MSTPDPYGAMPLWPYENAGLGDKSTLIRAAWQGTSSSIKTHPDVQSENSSGDNQDNYDDPEGWAPRINYGDVPACFATLGSNGGGAPNPSIVLENNNGMQTLRTKLSGSVDCATSLGYRQVLRMVSREGPNDPVYTNHYVGANHKAVAYNTTNNNLWYMEAWVREISNGGYHQPRVTMWLFGTAQIGSNYTYQIPGYLQVEGGTYDSPSSGSIHFRQKQLEANGAWTRLRMVCKFDNPLVERLAMRIDINDGHSTYDIITHWDRMQLHPIGIGLGSDITGVDPDRISDINTGSYAT